MTRRVGSFLAITVLLTTGTLSAQPRPAPAQGSGQIPSDQVPASGSGGSAPAPTPNQPAGTKDSAAQGSGLAIAPAPSPGSGLTATIHGWSLNLYGFTELDIIQDSTESLSDLPGNSLIAKPGTYGANHQRTQFSVRNSRIGFKVASPMSSHGIQAKGILEMDFLGNPPAASEGALFNNPVFRIRHMALQLNTPVVDILAGQYWELFGWQSYFHPNTVELQGVPVQVYSRTAQLRLSHTFKTRWVSFEIAAVALRPPQRDSSTPDGQAGLKIMFNKWKGVRTAGSTGTETDAAAIGVSGVVRKFSVQSLENPGSDASAIGSGLSLDAFVPIIPATKENRANGLTVTGSFVTGTGIADLYTGLSGGYAMPKVPGSGSAYNIDPGLVAFDSSGNLQTINWQSFMVGVQYYLPPKGNVWLAANYARLNTSNGASLASSAKGAVNSTAGTLSSEEWFDGNIFWDVTPAARIGFEYARTVDTYNDSSQAPNNRYQLSFFYLF